MKEKMDTALERFGQGLSSLAPSPSQRGMERSRRRVQTWLREVAPEVGWTAIDSPLGRLMLAASHKGLLRISFAADEDSFLQQLDGRYRLLRDPPWLGPYRSQLRRYFRGELQSFSLKVDTSNLTDFQRMVLETIRSIPRGAVWTYGQVASAIDKPAAARAVGQALAKNPIPIVLPCHRVIASDSGLGGYAGGISKKRHLLQLEGVPGFS